jgi:hypothetical protein
LKDVTAAVLRGESPFVAKRNLSDPRIDLKVGHYKLKRTPAPKSGPPQKVVPAKNKDETKMAA